VIIGGRQEFVHPALNPSISFHTSTVWTVPITAGMIAVNDIVTLQIITPAEVIALGNGMACSKISKDSSAVRVKIRDGLMTEQGLERNISFHDRAGQEERRVYPFVALSDGDRSW
jgi:hypothetical protein